MKCCVYIQCSAFFLLCEMCCPMIIGNEHDAKRRRMISLNEARASDGGGIGGSYSNSITQSYMAAHTRKSGMREHGVDCIE